jgi:predicted Zn-dependent protease
MIHRLFICAIVATVTMLAAPPAPVHAAGNDLPDIGSPADTVISKGQARQIGRSIVAQMRQAGQILEDPELEEYIESLGHRLSAQAHDGDQRFDFFVVNDGAINAFALPGGFVGVNAGLILQTERESELAGVLAHEIAHVTQNHIARRAQSSGRSSLLAAAAVMAAIAMGISGAASGEAVQAAAMSAQAYAVQQSINYTRVNEYEADRVGLVILQDAEFDPYGMPDFFETMSRLQGSMANRIPEFLLTHPVGSTRIAETRSRADKLEKRPVSESDQYQLIRERLRVIRFDTAEDAVAYYEGRLESAAEPYPYLRYGLALALIRDSRAKEAVPILYELRAENDSSIAFHSGLGQAMMAAGEPNESVIVFESAMALFPRNMPLTVRYAEALMYAQQYDKAHAILLDLFNNVSPSPAQVRLIANAASAAGQTAEAYYYMSDYYARTGNLVMAIEQLNLALAQPDLEDTQRARFEARRNELTPYLQKNQQPRSMEPVRRAAG